MFWVRIALVLIYPGALLLTLQRRPRQAAAAANAAGSTLEGGWFVRSPRAPRLVVWIVAALMVSFMGKGGVAIAFVMALITAPIAAAGSLRLLATCSAGLILDERCYPWEQFSAFTARRGAREVVLLWRDAKRAPLAYYVRGGAFAAATQAIGRHLAQIEPTEIDPPPAGA